MDKLNFDDFEPIGEIGASEFVRYTRDRGLYGAVLGHSTAGARATARKG